VRFALVGGGGARGRRRGVRRTTHQRRGTTHDVTGAALVVPDLATLGRGCTANEGAGGNFERDWLRSQWARGRFFLDLARDGRGFRPYEESVERWRAGDDR